MPSKYTKSIQKRPKGSNHRGRDRNKNITCPYLEPNQSMKLTSEEGLKSIDTLTQDQRLHTKEFFNLWSKALYYQTLTYSFPSILSKINIRGSFAKPFYELYPQKPHATQEEFPSLNKKKSKPHQRGRRKDSKEPKSLYNEEEGDPPSLLQRGIENTY